MRHKHKEKTLNLKYKIRNNIEGSKYKCSKEKVLKLGFACPVKYVESLLGLILTMPLKK
jgi:hypothetical protein